MGIDSPENQQKPALQPTVAVILYSRCDEGKQQRVYWNRITESATVTQSDFSTQWRARRFLYCCRLLSILRWRV
jgi:hypothetical protein